jgi:hypothetical protein
MTWKHRLRLISIASAALVLSASAASAQTFGFNIMDLDRPNGTSPWHGLQSYTFKSGDGDATKSITVSALSLKASSGQPVTLAEGADSAGSIGLLANGDDEQKVYLSEALHIRLGQQATKVELTLKDLHALDRQVLWTVTGKDAKGRTIVVTGNIQGKGVANDESETFVIDQDALTSTPGQPAGGFTGPVAIEEITLSSLHEYATLPQFGSIRFDQSFLLVGIQATVGGEDEEEEEDDDNNTTTTRPPPTTTTTTTERSDGKSRWNASSKGAAPPRGPPPSVAGRSE